VKNYEIKIDYDQQLKPTLPSLLKEIESFGKNLTWTILDLWATGDLGEGKSILDLEKNIKTSETGMILNWDELCELSNKFYQVIEIRFAGSTNINLIERKDIHNNFSSSEIYIDLTDGYSWEIHTKNQALIEHLKNIFL
jgi:hypothetical protein